MNDIKDNIITLIFKWLEAQSFNNIIMLLILGQTSWVGYSLITTTLPSIYSEIVKHNTELTIKAEEERKKILDALEKERERMSLLCDKWVNLLSNKSRDTKSIVTDKEHEQ